MKLFSSIAGFFRARYIGLVEFVATCLTLLTNKVLRHYILLKGKNPDYMAPLATQPQLTLQDVTDTMGGKRSFYGADPVRSYKNEGSWVRNPEKHPIRSVRTTGSVYRAEEALQVALANSQVPAQDTAVALENTATENVSSEVLEVSDSPSKEPEPPRTRHQGDVE